METDFAWEFGKQIHPAYSFFRISAELSRLCLGQNSYCTPFLFESGRLKRRLGLASDQDSPQRVNKGGISDQNHQISEILQAAAAQQLALFLLKEVVHFAFLARFGVSDLALSLKLPTPRTSGWQRKQMPFLVFKIFWVKSHKFHQVSPGPKSQL